MTRLSTLDGSLTVTGIGNAAVLAVDVETVMPGGFVIDFLLTNQAGVAAADRGNRLGVRAVFGLGEGVSQVIGAHELTRVVITDESVQGYGDRLELTLAGARFSHFARNILAARNQIEIFLKYGATPVTEYSRRVFTGHILSSSFSDPPPTGSLVALDGAALYAVRKAKTYVVPENSGKTRLQIFTEVCAEAEIPIRSADFGANGGGVYNKAFACGDRVVLDVMRDFLAVIGVEIGFIENELVAVRYDPNAPSVAELTPANVIAPSTLAVPETISPNVLGVVCVATRSTEPSGTRTPAPDVVVTSGPYAIQQYAERWDGGVSSAGPGPAPESIQVISEVVTQPSYFGTLEIRSERTERGWYAPRWAHEQIKVAVVGPSTLEEYEEIDRQVNPSAHFVFPDGSTRAVYAESFQTISRETKTKTLNADRYVTRVREDRYKIRPFRVPLFVVGGIGGDIGDRPPADWTNVSDDGEGMAAPESLALDGITIADYDVNADGEITEERVTEYAYSIGSEVMRRDGAYGYGLDDPAYTMRPSERVTSAFPPIPPVPPPANATEAELIDYAEDVRLYELQLHNFYVAQFGFWRTTTKTYRTLRNDEDRIQIVTAVSENGEPPQVTTDTQIGSLPRAERAEAETTTQEIRQTIEDGERIAFAGGELIEDIEHNEYIQNAEEARTYAMIRARKASARVLTCDMPIEALIHKWKMVTVRLPGSSIDGLRFWVTGVRRDVGAFRESVTAESYSPLLLSG